jgi:hypothetical protein
MLPETNKESPCGVLLQYLQEKLSTCCSVVFDKDDKTSMTVFMEKFSLTKILLFLSHIKSFVKAKHTNSRPTLLLEIFGNAFLSNGVRLT